MITWTYYAIKHVDTWGPSSFIGRFDGLEICFTITICCHMWKMSQNCLRLGLGTQGTAGELLVQNPIPQGPKPNTMWECIWSTRVYNFIKFKYIKQYLFSKFKYNLLNIFLSIYRYNYLNSDKNKTNINNINIY
jgi:hypothetical protein